MHTHPICARFSSTDDRFWSYDIIFCKLNISQNWVRLWFFDTISSWWCQQYDVCRLLHIMPFLVVTLNWKRKTSAKQRCKTFYRFSLNSQFSFFYNNSILNSNNNSHFPMRCSPFATTTYRPPCYSWPASHPSMSASPSVFQAILRLVVLPN